MKRLKELMSERLKKLERLTQLIYPYGERFEREEIAKVRERYERSASHEPSEERVRVAGRIKAIRLHGKAAFADLEDRSGRIQLYLNYDTLEQNYDFFRQFIDPGDIIGVIGRVFRTKKGELSIWVDEFKLLAKSIRPLPKEWFGLKDVEKRFRERYLDMIMNREVREKIMIWSKLLNVLREFLLRRGFIEVTTPSLQPVYGGAFARPFTTYHHFLKQEMFLSISPELYLKRLLVGGLEKVFEFAKCFRNEAVDAQHNAEFLQLELYQAYANYEDTMKLVEQMISYAAKRIFNTTEIEFQGRRINLAPPWKRLRMVDAIEEYGKIDVLALSRKELKEIAERYEVRGVRWGDFVEGLFEKIVQPHLQQPTFITHFPADITPLAKRCSDDPRFVERYEGYIAGWEIINGYTELNNPIEQFKRFEEEEELRRKSGKREIEYQPMDRDYVRALEYGMPPASGVGIGLARLLCIFTNTTSIKEVIIFPTLAMEKGIRTLCDMFPKAKELFD